MIFDKDRGWYRRQGQALPRPYFPGRSLKREPLKISITQHVENLLSRDIIQPRDYRLLRMLLKSNVLSRDQIWRLYWPGNTKRAVNERLKKLWCHWILDYRTDIESMMSAGMRPCRLYYLNSVSKEVLRYLPDVSEADLSQARRYTGTAVRLLPHDMMISEFQVQLYLAGQALDMPLSWANEREAIVYEQTPTRLNDGPAELVRPDAALQLDTNAHYGSMTYYFELDRGGTDWPQKLSAYRAAYAAGDWAFRLGQDRFPPVLCLVPDRAFRGLSRRLGNHSGAVVYWLKTWSSFLETGPLTGWLDTLTREQVSLLPASLLAETPPVAEAARGK